jgi:membrane fusion protein (multidrug efflux system)
LVPLVAIAGGGYWYVYGARYVSTDNAYVRAAKTTISAEVSGRIASVLVGENEAVPAGHPLLTIDDEVYRIALSRAEAERATVIARLDALRAQIRQKHEELELATIMAGYAEREHNRGATLAARSVVSVSKLDEARNRMDSARQQMAIVRQEIERLVVDLGGDELAPADRHPAVRQAQAMVDEARVALERTKVFSPVDGIVSRVDSIRPGDHVRPGVPLFSVVATSQKWIEANFKETDLTRVVAGQPVEVTVDTFPGVKLPAEVHSIGAATGAEFALIPPQNASGNWVKIVQRIPVRIRLLEARSLPLLRAGMSAQVTIDTGYNRPLPSLVARAVGRAGNAE